MQLSSLLQAETVLSATVKIDHIYIMTSGYSHGYRNDSHAIVTGEGCVEMQLLFPVLGALASASIPATPDGLEPSGAAKTAAYAAKTAAYLLWPNNIIKRHLQCLQILYKYFFVKLRRTTLGVKYFFSCYDHHGNKCL